MTVLDTFTLDFKTSNTSNTSADISKLDKQLDEMAKKGKKRTEDENKQYEVLKKQRKELLENTKQQQRETEKLKDSFSGMIESAVGAATAYASFSFLKEGLKDANRLNASLSVLGKITQTNAGEIKKYGQALALSGGNAEDLYAFVAAEANEAAKGHTTFNLKRLIENAHNAVKNDPQFLTKIQQVPGGTALLPWLLLPDKEFNEKLAQADDQVELSKKDEDAALKNQEAYAKTKASFESLATEIDTHLLQTITALNDALSDLAEAFRGHPVAAEAAGAGATVAATYGGWRVLSWLKGLAGRGAAGAAAGAGEATAGVTAGAVAAIAATAAAAVWGFSAAGVGLGNWIKGTPSPPNPNSPSNKQASSSSNKKESIAFWESQGYTPAQAAAWAANEQAESSFNPIARNGTHSGIFQWSSSRRAKILAETGIDILTASHAEQLRAAAWEARSMGLGPLALPTNTSGAAAAISNQFEVPATTPYGLLMEAQKRANIANGIYGQLPLAGFAAGAGANKTVNIKIDDVTVHTQATDAAGIAQGFSSEMKNQLRMLASNVDDGEFA